MRPVQTWGGRFFGWICDDGLFARNGRHVGQIYRGIVYAENGHYLGELRDGRLITDTLRKDTHRWYGFFANPEPTKGAEGEVKDAQALPLPEGCEEFPDLSSRSH
jgi:hypothetical protein